jgi:heparan-alpha-glucosaminide N-acetyltransferase
MSTPDAVPASSDIPATPLPKSAAPPTRLASMDAYRGFVMFLMMAEVLHLGRVAANLRAAGTPSAIWNFLAHHQDHVEWVGCVLHDMIQPSFSFLVGVAVPFSIAARIAKGQTPVGMWVHGLWRALILVLLGVFLRSTGSGQTNWTLEDTLSQIGLGYPILFALGFAKPRIQWAALGVILLGYWLAFALHPVPTGFDYEKVGVSAQWLKDHGHTGFAAHWQKNSNFAWAADKVIMNWFPRPKPWEFNGGGYSTLSFIPTLGTMILGLIAGGVIRGERTPTAKLQWLAIAGVVSLAAGGALGTLGICPVVKRIWTPSWTLYSGGWCFLLLAAFYAVVDVAGRRGWSYPLRVIGLNSIAAYTIAHLWDSFIARNLKTHLGQDFFAFAGKTYEPFFQGAAVLLVLWLILFWMERRKLFLKI